MAARPYSATPPLEFQNGTTTAIVHYEGAKSSTPLMPVLPGFRDAPTAHKFYSNLTSLANPKLNPHLLPVTKVDENIFITFGMGLEPCGTNATCSAPIIPSDYKFSANMNNISFVLPSKLSMLEAYHGSVKGIYTEDFPDRPHLEYSYTDPNLAMSYPLIVIEKETCIKRLKYNSVVEIVLQNTASVAAENHPMHFHGFDFYVLAQGFGNYDPISDPKKFNLVNPQECNTTEVPIAGWAVIRFRDNNPDAFHHLLSKLGVLDISLPSPT